MSKEVLMQGQQEWSHYTFFVDKTYIVSTWKNHDYSRWDFIDGKLYWSYSIDHFWRIWGFGDNVSSLEDYLKLELSIRDLLSR